MAHQLQYHTAWYSKPHGKTNVVSPSMGKLGWEMILASGAARLQGTEGSLEILSHHTLPGH